MTLPASLEGGEAGAPGRFAARDGAALAAATLLSGVLGYAFILLLTRSLGPVEYGVLGALLGVALLASVSATALQLELTRAVAAGEARELAPLLRRSASVTVLTCAVVLAATPLLVSGLRLPGADGVVALAGLLVTQTFAGGLQGIMLGRGRPSQFGVLLVAMALSRVAAAVITVAAEGGATFALTVSALTALPVVALGLALLMREPALPRTGGGSGAGTFAGLVRAGGGAGALMLLLNADLLASRAVLDPTASGHYAFVTIFGRVTFWGTNFIALWVFPHVAAQGDTARAERAAVGAVLGVGAVAGVVAWLGGDLLTENLAGPDYLAAAGYAPGLAAAGALMALVQLAVYVDVARSRHLLTVATAAAGLVLLGAIPLLGADSIGEIVALTLVALAVVALAGLSSMARAARAADLVRSHPAR